MRFEILEPQPLAAEKRWQWQIVGDREEVLAKSAELPSEAQCHLAIEQVLADFRHGEPQVVFVTAPKPNK